MELIIRGFDNENNILLSNGSSNIPFWLVSTISDEEPEYLAAILPRHQTPFHFILKNTLEPQPHCIYIHNSQQEPKQVNNAPKSFHHLYIIIKFIIIRAGEGYFSCLSNLPHSPSEIYIVKIYFVVYSGNIAVKSHFENIHHPRGSRLKHPVSHTQP